MAAASEALMKRRWPTVGAEEEGLASLMTADSDIVENKCRGVETKEGDGRLYASEGRVNRGRKVELEAGRGRSEVQVRRLEG